jgi:heme-degrading monooxygenase HmoA
MMYIRLTTLFIKPDKIDEAVRIFETSVVPAAQSQRGFRAAYLLTERGTGKCPVLTFWEKEKDAADNEENLYYQEQLVKFMSLYSSPPVKEGYEVAVEAHWETFRKSG